MINNSGIIGTTSLRSIETGSISDRAHVTHKRRFNSIKSNIFKHYWDSVAAAVQISLSVLIPDFFFFLFLFFYPFIRFFLCASSTKSLSVCRARSVLASSYTFFLSRPRSPHRSPGLGKNTEVLRGGKTSVHRRQDERTGAVSEWILHFFLPPSPPSPGESKEISSLTALS